ncbi:hypothetical protein [Mesobacillus selenatarsenatis]|uniref:Uncharacterized protein n=1 Tax=Mesobacillus selenatarsenatis (strain DSM 18680 / JCM 14380 / FERM P-15431 / SF-1) TaxID=1321606 RepID=A0A0A8XAA5_MESS1|nr:hypothetical protein [Mesobacillus selenatarsenatis]GAM16219.1 hypothetical protein SAMD00020551_4407 [Mesobacillus selenatarsenatis SF-1]
MKDVKVEEASNLDFVAVLKNAYEKGLNDKEMTVEKILEELKIDLKNIITI